MNLKKNTGKNTEGIKEAAVSIIILVLTGAITGIITYYMNKSTAEMMRYTITLMMGGVILLFLWYQSALNQSLEYDNEEHQIRFFGVYFVCYLISIGMILLPVGSWVFLAIMVVLSMFSNSFMGLAGGSVLLVTTVGLTQDATIYIFFLYFMIGLIGIALFRKLDLDFRVGEPLFLSALASFVLQIGYLVIFENQPLSIEILILPILNIFVNLILLFIILKYFSHLSMYYIQDKYEEINDPEFPLLAELKQNNKEEYFEAIHRAYLGERISKRLNLNDKAVRGCCYYYKMGLNKKEHDKDDISLQEYYDFPQELKLLMEECMEERYGSREACVVLTSDRVFSKVRDAQKKYKDGQVPYEQIIASIFNEMIRGACLLDCDMSLKELRIMEKVFMEEKLYYDFLR